MTPIQQTISQLLQKITEAREMHRKLNDALNEITKLAKKLNNETD